MELKKIIIAPDSFKGALTAAEVTQVIAAQVKEIFPSCEIVKMPIADGGEGSVEAILSATGGVELSARVLSPDERLIDASFGILGSGEAVIEMASSSGLTKQNGLHPMTSNTFGFGQLILAAAEHGARDFTLCIGGSATTDGGCAMAAALGIEFFDKAGRAFIPCGETLIDIERIETAGLYGGIRDSRFTVMCDVENPLFGLDGAAYIYGPQKGASSEQIEELDRGLRHFGELLEAHFGHDMSNVAGSGAAGGLGAGCLVFLNAQLMRGSEAILKLCDFDRHVSDTELIITGEGRLDFQSFKGKVLSGILRSAGDVPVWSVCGLNECDAALLQKHKMRVFEASEGISVEESMANPTVHLANAARKAMLEYKAL